LRTIPSRCPSTKNLPHVSAGFSAGPRRSTSFEDIGLSFLAPIAHERGFDLIAFAFCLAIQQRAQGRRAIRPWVARVTFLQRPLRRHVTFIRQHGLAQDRTSHENSVSFSPPPFSPPLLIPTLRQIVPGSHCVAVAEEVPPGRHLTILAAVLASCFSFGGFETMIFLCPVHITTASYITT